MRSNDHHNIAGAFKSSENSYAVRNMTRWWRYGWRSRFREIRWNFFSIVTSAEILLEPHIKDDEKISATHLLNLEFRFSGLAVLPSDWCHGPGVSTQDGLQR